MLQVEELMQILSLAKHHNEAICGDDPWYSWDEDLVVLVDNAIEQYKAAK